jgi:hypothetical protein
LSKKVFNGEGGWVGGKFSICEVSFQRDKIGLLIGV